MGKGFVICYKRWNPRLQAPFFSPSLPIPLSTSFTFSWTLLHTSSRLRCSEECYFSSRLVKFSNQMHIHKYMHFPGSNSHLKAVKFLPPKCFWQKTPHAQEFKSTHAARFALAHVQMSLWSEQMQVVKFYYFITFVQAQLHSLAVLWR